MLRKSVADNSNKQVKRIVIKGSSWLETIKRFPHKGSRFKICLCQTIPKSFPCLPNASTCVRVLACACLVVAVNISALVFLSSLVASPVSSFSCRHGIV